jgi:hypothetical protein
MQGLDQFLLLTRLLQNDPVGWMQLVYLTGMFVALIWRKEAIVNWKLFRASYLFFGVSLLLPSIALPLTQMFGTSGGFSPRAPSTNPNIVTQILINAIGPACFAGAVICGLGSMAPQRTRIVHTAPATLHPLD